MATILFSSLIDGSREIAERMMEKGFKEKEDCWEWKGHKLIDTKVKVILEVPVEKIKDEYVIVASPHKSEANLKSLTVHVPGNWGSADFGGKERTLSFSYPSKMLDILLKMNELNEEYGLGFRVNYEVDHHGPTTDIPIMFAEIGSSKEEWKNKEAADVVAESIIHTLESKKKYRVKIGAGGGHYAPLFTQISLKEKIGFAHILPKYRADEVDFETIKQAKEKSVEKVEGIIIDKKGLTKEQREKIKKWSEVLGLEIEVR